MQLFRHPRRGGPHRARHPPRLAGRPRGQGDNPAAGAEVALGRSITACAHEVEPPPPEEVEGGVPPPAVGGGGSAAAGAGATTPVRHLAALKYAPVVTEAGRLSHQYDRARWGVEPPGEPATNADITLAIIVSLPEAIALVALVLTNPRWEKRDGLAFLLIWAAGGVSTAGVIQAAVNEAGGQRWRGSSERIVLSARLHQVEEKGHDRRLDRVPLFQTETLFLAARLGYRVRLLSGLAIGVTCTYMALSVGVAALAVRQTRREHMSWARDMDTAAANDDARHAGRVSTGTVRRYIHLPPNLAYRRSAAAAAEQEAADEWWA